MATTRLFSYNPSLNPISGTEQYGTLCVGVGNIPYSLNVGGVKWWNGPDEDLGYVIATVVPSENHSTPVGDIGTVEFWRTENLSNIEFLELANLITGQNFTTTNEAYTWLLSNDYWTSFIPTTSTPTPTTPTSTPTPTPTNSQTPTTPTSTPTPTPTTTNSLCPSNCYLSEIYISPTDLSNASGNTISGVNNMVQMAFYNCSGNYSTTNFTTSGYQELQRFRCVTSPESLINFNYFQDDVQIFTNLSTLGITNYCCGTVPPTPTPTPTNTKTPTNTPTPTPTPVTFAPPPNFFILVNSIDTQSDGKIMVGGSFGDGRQRDIVRLNVNGTIDNTYHPYGVGFTGNQTIVNQLKVLNNDVLLAIGEFTTYDEQLSNSIIKLDSEGFYLLNEFYEPAFYVGNTFSGDDLFCFGVQSDGKVVVGGIIGNYQIGPDYNITRLNTDGSLDSTFDFGTGFNDWVYSINVLSNDKILVGGGFSQYKGLTQNRLARLNADGSLDSSLNIGTGFNGTINSIVTQSDGKILVGGGFTTYKGLTQNGIVRLNTDGSLDSTFNIGTGFNTVYDGDKVIVVQSDGKILVGGEFTTYNGLSQNRIIRLNTDGSIDSTFVIGSGFDTPVKSFKIQTNGQILVGGSFDSYNGVAVASIVRLNTDGSLNN